VSYGLPNVINMKVYIEHTWEGHTCVCIV